MSDVDYVASVTIGFQSYLSDLKTSDDRWISTCGVFIEMAYNLLKFVNAFRIGDAIIIKHGYEKHSPVFEILGQNKYVEICLVQK